MKYALPAVLAFLGFAASTASAHPGYKIQMSAQFKETRKGKETFRNVFVTGHAHYPDGTTLKVGVRSEKLASYLLWATAVVRKEEFAAELGPWMQAFPPGKYVAEAWFDYAKQPDSIRAVLDEQEDFEKCLKDDPKYQEQYKKENPEKYEKLMKQMTATGRCASKKAFGACELLIGTTEDAAQSSDTERAFIRDHVDGTKELIAELLKTVRAHADPNKNSSINKDVYLEWATGWQERVSTTDTEISARRKGVVMTEFSDAYGFVSTALLSVYDLERIMQASLYGESSSMVAELEALLAKGEAISKDEKRRREQLKRELEGAKKTQMEMEQRVVNALADALYGNTGLDPAPARREVYVEELRAEYGLDWGPQPEKTEK